MIRPSDKWQKEGREEAKYLVNQKPEKKGLDLNPLKLLSSLIDFCINSEEKKGESSTPNSPSRTTPITDEEIDNLLEESEDEIDLELEGEISTDDNESAKLKNEINEKTESTLKKIFIFIFSVIAIVAGIAIIIALGPLWIIAILIFLLVLKLNK